MQTSIKMRFGQLKFVSFGLLLACTSCGAAERELASGVLQIGKIDNPKITESSGVIASRQYTNVFWTHNDGGKSDTLFALSREGKTLAEFKVAGVNFDDWEDIASDNEHRLYLADTGDNARKRKKAAVFQIEEPNPESGGGTVRVLKRWQFRFPQGPTDCETLFIHQTNGYVVTKVTDDRKAEVYRFSLQTGDSVQTVELVARLGIDSPVTGGDISGDGSAVALVSKSGAFLYRIDGDVSRLTTVRPYHQRFRHDSMEACTFVPDGLLATAESRDVLLFTAEPFRVLK
jgi:hypothetical protein